MSNQPSSDRLERVRQYIIEHKRANDGNSPSIRQIMIACAIPSSSVVDYYLDKLEAANVIRRKSRRIEVTGGRWTYQETQPS
jgi:SOS-response transcriptional repressor LexA